MGVPGEPSPGGIRPGRPLLMGLGGEYGVAGASWRIAFSGIAMIVRVGLGGAGVSSVLGSSAAVRLRPSAAPLVLVGCERCLVLCLLLRFFVFGSSGAFLSDGAACWLGRGSRVVVRGAAVGAISF